MIEQVELSIPSEYKNVVIYEPQFPFPFPFNSNIFLNSKLAEDMYPETAREKKNFLLKLCSK